MACSVHDHQSVMVRLVSACALGYVLDGVPCLDGNWMSPAQQMAWLFGAEWKPNIIIIIKVRVYAFETLQHIFIQSVRLQGISDLM